MKSFIVAGSIAGGLLLAGSDGDYFPWMNIVGILLLAIGGICAQLFWSK